MTTLRNQEQIELNSLNELKFCDAANSYSVVTKVEARVLLVPGMISFLHDSADLWSMKIESYNWMREFSRGFHNTIWFLFIYWLLSTVIQ